MAQRMMNPNLILNYADYLSNSQDTILTNQQYNYNVEFFNRRSWSGTIMPLSASCYSQRCDYLLRKSGEKWATYGANIKSTYKLTGLGESIYDLCNENNDFERSRLDGSMALWELRRNERRRQLEKVKLLSEQDEFHILRRKYQEYKDRSIAVYTQFYNTVNAYINEVLKSPDPNKIFRESIETYIHQQGKSHASLVPSLGLRYEDIFSNDLVHLARLQVKLNNTIMDHIYDRFRINPSNILSALRNRPADINKLETLKGLKLDISTSHCNLRNDRTREANGQPPESHEWMWVFLIKHHISKWIIDEFRKIYGVDFKTPVESSLQFYVDFVNKVDGLYLFGDNGMEIRNGEIKIYDLSISDVGQGLIRRDSVGRNLGFFLRLNPDYDCGSTGGSLTPYWNLEGQLIIWRCFKDKELEGDFPSIPNFLEPAGTFLGHWFREDGKISSKGLRTTKDSAKRASPIVITPGKTSSITWPIKTEIKRNELIQSVIASGVSDIDLKYFYNWALKKNYFTNDVYVEYKGINDQLDYVFKDQEAVQAFEDLIGIDELKNFAHPLAII